MDGSSSGSQTPGSGSSSTFASWAPRGAAGCRQNIKARVAVSIFQKTHMKFGSWSLALLPCSLFFWGPRRNFWLVQGLRRAVCAPKHQDFRLCLLYPVAQHPLDQQMTECSVWKNRCSVDNQRTASWEDSGDTAALAGGSPGPGPLPAGDPGPGCSRGGARRRWGWRRTAGAAGRGSRSQR